MSDKSNAKAVSKLTRCEEQRAARVWTGIVERKRQIAKDCQDGLGAFAPEVELAAELLLETEAKVLAALIKLLSDAKLRNGKQLHLHE